MVKSTAGFVLALIGGIFTLITSFVFLLLTIFATSILGSFNVIGGDNLLMMPIILTIWFFVIGILSIVSASLMNRETSVKTGAVMSMIFGVLAINILTLVGGIIGIIQSGNSVAKPSIIPTQQNQAAVQQYIQQLNTV